MPALILVVVDPSGKVKELSYKSDKVESGFEFTSNLVKKGNDVLTVSLFDEGHCVRRQMRVDKSGETEKRQFSKLFHSKHLGYVQIN